MSIDRRKIHGQGHQVWTVIITNRRKKKKHFPCLYQLALVAGLLFSQGCAKFSQSFQFAQ